MDNGLQKPILFSILMNISISVRVSELRDNDTKL